MDVHDLLVRESLSALSGGFFYPWPEKINVEEKWHVCGAKWQNEMVDASPLVVLKSAIRPFNGLIVNAGLSLMPGCSEISPHEGYTGEVLRFHYGLKVPKGECALRVGKEIRYWTEGDALLFDDTQEHEAWNRTNSYRMIVILDLRKSELTEMLELHKEER